MRDRIVKIHSTTRYFFRRQAIRNVSSVVLANLISTVVSLSVAFVIPKFLPVADYSYWQLYVFYISYIGIMHLGIADGVYLRFGGKKYEELDKNLFRSQFYATIAIQLVASAAVALGALYLLPDGDRRLIALLVGANLLLINARTFLQMLLQATNRMVEYSRNLILERVVYVALIATFLFLGQSNFYYVILADVIAKTIMLFLLCCVCRDLVFGRLYFGKIQATELWANMSAGMKLLFANLAGMLVVGVVRIIIEHRWGIIAFGEVSLILTVSSLVMVFITAAGVVVYPVLKRTASERLSQVYSDFRDVLIPLMLVFLLFYFPAKYILDLWLPQYSSALSYLSLVFPMAFFEAKTQILTNTFLKAYRLEGKLLIINLCSLIISALLALFTAFILHSIELTILVIVTTLALKSIISERTLSRVLDFKYLINNSIECSLIVLFIVLTIFAPSYAFVLYSLVVLIYIYINRMKIKTAVNRTFLSHQRSNS